MDNRGCRSADTACTTRVVGGTAATPHVGIPSPPVRMAGCRVDAPLWTLAGAAGRLGAVNGGCWRLTADVAGWRIGANGPTGFGGGVAADHFKGGEERGWLMLFIEQWFCTG